MATPAPRTSRLQSSKTFRTNRTPTFASVRTVLFAQIVHYPFLVRMGAIGRNLHVNDFNFATKSSCFAVHLLNSHSNPIATAVAVILILTPQRERGGFAEMVKGAGI